MSHCSFSGRGTMEGLSLWSQSLPPPLAALAMLCHAPPSALRTRSREYLERSSLAVNVPASSNHRKLPPSTHPEYTFQLHSSPIQSPPIIFPLLSRSSLHHSYHIPHSTSLFPDSELLYITRRQILIQSLQSPNPVTHLFSLLFQFSQPTLPPTQSSSM